MSYAKLFGSILSSTIWLEDHHVVRVWIAMLALKDQDGIVEGAIPGLAHQARVTTEQAEEALEKFLAPDKYSRTPDHDGRRIEKVPDGWRVLNHQKYRDKEDLEERREKNRNRQQSRRDRDKARREKKAERAASVTRHATSRNVTPGHAASPQVTPSDTETDAFPDGAPARVPDPDQSLPPSGDPGHGGGGDLVQGAPPIGRGWARASGAAVPQSPLPGANTRDVATVSRVSDPDPDPQGSERKRLIAALAPLHVERYRAVREAIGSTVPLLAHVQAEKAIRDHLLLQVDLTGYEERARHVLAVREAEARKRTELRYFGVGLWREPAWGIACGMEVGASGDPSRAKPQDVTVGRIEPPPASEFTTGTRPFTRSKP